jgi:chromosome segregation ATPase
MIIRVYNLENFLLLTILGVLTLYFFSSMNVYRSLYKKVNEEKNILQDEIKKLEDLKRNYEQKIKGSIAALETKHDNLQVARSDLQALRVENTELKHKVERLERRCDELYAQIHTMV